MKTLLIGAYRRLRQRYSHGTTMQIGRIVAAYPSLPRWITVLYLATFA